MKFNVTNIIEIAPSLTAENFELLIARCTSAVVDIRNPSATVTNLKAAAVVKLKVKDPLTLRLVAVFSSDGSDAVSARRAQVIDELEADRKSVLSKVFSSDAGNGVEHTIQLYALRTSEASPTPAYASEVSDPSAGGAMYAMATVGKLTNSAAASPSPSATATPVPAGAENGDKKKEGEMKEGSVGATKRSRDEGADDADRSALASPASNSTDKSNPAERSAAVTNDTNNTTNKTESETPAAAESIRAAAITSTPVEAEDDWEDANDDDEATDGEVEEDGFEEGDEWGSEDDDGIEWAHGMDLDHFAGLVPELAPAERELVLELVSLPNAGVLIQKVMDGNAAEAMAEVQTANPRLFTLIGEHSGLFTELMDDIKDMMETGIISSSEGVVEHLRGMVNESNEADELFGSEDDDEARGEEGEGEGEAAERRRQRRAQNEAEMADALNAFAGGASEMRPLNDLDETRITTLVELGFDRNKAVAAYLRMGRNVERAANFLFENI